MSKKLIAVVFTFLFLGCNNLSVPNLRGDSESSDRITTSVDSENEVIGVGSEKIGSSGALVANGKATRQAKSKLKSRILAEQEIIFKSFLISADPHTKKILSPVLSDLMDYSATQLLQKAVEKDSWTENNKVYIVYSISKNEILNESQNIFNQYLDDLTNKFQLTKEEVNKSE